MPTGGVMSARPTPARKVPMLAMVLLPVCGQREPAMLARDRDGSPPLM
jgi:hypothetical protein